MIQPDNTAGGHIRSDIGMEELAQRLNAICVAQPFKASWCVGDIRTGRSAGRDEHVPTPSASTRKILFMMAALKAVHEGEFSLDEQVVARKDLMEGVVSGVLYFMTPGLTFPLRDAIVQMIITSDNVCTSLVGERLGPERITEFARSVGMAGTTIHHIVPPRDMPADSVFDFVAQTTPADQVLLLGMIVAGSRSEAEAAKLGTSSQWCRFALDVLSWQRYREGIPGLLPIDTRVANKTGGGRNGLMDAGVVYRDDHPLYALSVYTDAVPWTMSDGLPGHAAARATIARISRQCWDFF